MFASLNPGMLGVQANLPATIELAARYGFKGADLSIAEAVELARTHGVAYVKDLFAGQGIRPGTWGLPVEFRRDQAAWQRDLATLPELATVAAEIGATRTATYIMPCDDERDFRTNFRYHVERLAPIAAILQEYGCRLGLEYVGPRTLRHSRRYSFVYTLDGMLALCAAVGDNTGLLLDAFHFYTAHDDLDEVSRLHKDDVVVHVNDAPAGVAVDEQLDQVRALPAETRVLDLAGFLQALAAIAYDGPVAAEPFSRRLRELPADQALAETADAMRTIGLIK